MIKKCNMQNYSIFYKDNLLYAYFEYTGSDFAADMARMAADEMPSASGVLRGSLPEPAISRLVRQAGINESRLNPANPTPACLRNALRFNVIP